MRCEDVSRDKVGRHNTLSRSAAAGRTEEEEEEEEGYSKLGGGFIDCV